MRRLTPLAMSTVSFAALMLAAIPTAASAQTQGQDDTTVTGKDAPKTEDAVEESGDAATLAQEGQADKAAGEAIVVTGSRIRRSEFNSPDPISVISPELARQQGQNEVAELLTNSPLAAGSVQITSAISTNFVTEGGSDAQTVGLRGLGAARTLVLLNGRRAGPAGTSGQISSFDLNVIPLSVVRSIEILKTGASSIYGSDAVAGVINILTKRDTDGIEFRLGASAPQDSGGEVYNASLAYGKDFGRGHFLVTGDYYKRNDLQRRDRKYLDCQDEFLTFQDGDRADIVDSRTGRPACSGTLGNSILVPPGLDFSGPGFTDGFVAPRPAPFNQQLFVFQYAVGNELNGACLPINGFRPGILAPANLFGCNFDGPSTGVLNQYGDLERFSDVSSDLERYTLYADGAYELTENLEIYTELLYNKRKTYTDGVGQISATQFVGFSPALTNAFCANTPGTPGGDFNCRNADAGDPFNSELRGNFLIQPLVLYDADGGTDIDYYRGVLGVRGDIGSTFLSGWAYDVYGQYSRSDGDYFQDIALDDALYSLDYRTRSCAGLTTQYRDTGVSTGRQCLDIDLTDPRVLRGEFTDAERAFLFTREHSNTLYEQISGEATVTGTLFALPAGDLGAAFGVQLRQDKIKDTPGENFIIGNAFNRSSAGITAGKTLAKEVFGEVQIPLIHNTPFIQSLVLSGAARYTQVDAERSDGEKDDFNDITWKAGFDWAATDWLRFRGSWGTSFRAPALFELFLQDQTGFLQVQTTDLCLNLNQRLASGQVSQIVFNNCIAAGIPGDFQGNTGGFTTISGGGLGVLEPETSVAKTLSVVFTPQSWFWGGGRASLALDYFDITVNDQISQLGGANIVAGCYASEFGADEPLCDLITRETSGPDQFNITEVQDSYINVNRQTNRGLDLTGRFIQDMGRWGRLSFLTTMSWQFEDTTTLFEGSTADDNGESGEPIWIGNFDVTWNKDDTTLYYGVDVIGATSEYSDFLTQQGSAIDAAGCRTSIFRPGVPLAEAFLGGRRRFCPDVRQETTVYHAASITQEIADKFAITFGVSNLFDKRPPRVSTVFNGGINNFVGQVAAFGSQYDILGRRFFVNVSGKF